MDGKDENSHYKSIKNLGYEETPLPYRKPGWEKISPGHYC